MTAPAVQAPRIAAPPHAAAVGAWALVVALLFVTRTFQYFPGMAWVQEAAIATAPIGLAVLMLRRPASIGQHRVFECYVALLVVVMPLWSGIAAMQAYGQPAIFGILAWRGYALLCFALFVLYAVHARLFDISALDRAFVQSAWATTALFVLMRLLLEPADYVDYGLGFVEDRGAEGFRFKFNAVCGTYAMFHYTVRGLRESNPGPFLLAALFGAFMFGSAGGRVMTVSVVLALLVVQVHWGGWARIWRGVAGLAAVLALIVGVASAVAPEETHERLDKFADAFSVLGLDADLIEDPSAASRTLQVLVALPMIEERPIAGNGRISSQWIEDGYMGYLGAHFFPDDIGIVGMLLQFGVLGTLILFAQFVFGWRCARQIDRRQSSVASDTAELYLTYLAISSVATGSFVMFPELSVLLVAMLVAHAASGQERRRG